MFDIDPTKKAEIDKPKLKMQGIEFEGVMCSATAADQWGLKSVEDDVKVDGNSVPFHFENGNVLVLTPANFDAFKAVWKPFRRTFFV